MGTNDKESFPNERPAHFVQVQGFWMVEHDVTNAEFSKFVEATGYVTTAERKVDWEDGDPYAPNRVVKGGSFLCNPSYCESYRSSARRGTPPDTGSSHTGFPMRDLWRQRGSYPLAWKPTSLKKIDLF
jgi:formylglycine-generating enzyme required for sulfatase activity